MQRILAETLPQHLNQEVRVRGWLNNIRPFGKVNFLILRDRTGLIQVVIEDKAEFGKVQKLQPGSIVQIHAQVVTSQCEMGVELCNPKIIVEVPIQAVPPLEYYKPQIPCDLETILDHRPVALRNRQLQAVFRIQAEIAHAFRLYMHDKVGGVEYFAPNIIGTSSEGGAEFFNVDYFGHTATLAQSSQLYKQIMVGVNERVFALMPFFRAEPSHTPRHLSEGKQFEFEMGFFEHWHEVLDVQEGCIKFIIEYLKQYCATDIDTLGGTLIEAPTEVAIPRFTFAEAQQLYYEISGVDERQEPDLSPAAERALCQYALEKYKTQLVFVTDWKLEKRPFYSYPHPQEPELTHTFDLLCAGTEITSGGQRRHTYDSMVEGIRLKGMNPENFEDYLTIFKYGMPVHGGFGMGLERLTMTLLQLKNIREASLFPSDPRRIASVRLKAKIFFGAENIRNEIVRLLRAHSVEFEHSVHEETPRSEDSARVRGTPLDEGVKALILKGKQSKKNYMFVLLGDQKLDMKAVAALTNEKCEFESPEVIAERFGLQIGGVPPWGQLLNLETFFDHTIEKKKTIHFNCGLRTESMTMQAKDLIGQVQPILVDIRAEVTLPNS